MWSWIAFLFFIPLIFLGLFLFNILRGQTPAFFDDTDFEPKSDADYKSRIIELASSVTKKIGGAVNINFSRKVIRRHNKFFQKLLTTAELPLSLLRDEFHRQKVVFLRYYFTPRDSLFPLLYNIIRQYEGKIDGKNLSYAVNIFNSEKPLSDREISCMRDMLGAALLWYIGKNAIHHKNLSEFSTLDAQCSISVKRIYNSCLSLSSLDDFWRVNRSEYIDAGFVPLDNLRKFPCVLALDGNILTDRGRDFCEVFIDGESVFDTTAVSVSPYAFKYIKGGGNIYAESICTVEPGSGVNLLLCNIFTNVGKIVEIEVMGNGNTSDIYIIINGSAHDIKQNNGVFRVWVETAINFEIIECFNFEQNSANLRFSYAGPLSSSQNDSNTLGRNSLILASLIHKSDPAACNILSRIFYDCPYIALEICGNSGLSRLSSLLPSLEYSRNFCNFDIYLVFHEREDSLIKYQKIITDFLNDKPRDFAIIVNTAVTPFDGKFYNSESPNPIIKIFSKNNPPLIIADSSLKISLPHITTPNQILNSKLNDYSKISIEQILKSAPLYYGISGQLTSAFILPYISAETLKEFIIFFCNLQYRHGEIHGAYQNCSLLAGLITLYIQISGDTNFIYKKAHYNDKTLGTILEHALRSIEYCHYNNLTMPLSYEFLGKLLPYVKNNRTLKNCLNIIAKASFNYNDPNYPGIVFHTFVEKTLGITQLNVDTLRFSPNMPDLWKDCSIILNNTTYQLIRQNNTTNTIIIEEEGRELTKDTLYIKGKVGKVVTVKY